MYCTLFSFRIHPQHLLLLGALLFSADCKRRSSEEMSSQASPADSSKAKKFSIYTGCHNQFSSAMRDIIQAYFSWADPEKGPQPQNLKNPPKLSILSDEPKECIEKIRKTSTEKPKVPELDNPAMQYVEILQSFPELSKKISRYYEYKDYETNPAQAKEFHAQMISHYEKLQKVMSEWGPAFNKIEDDQTQQAIQRAKSKKDDLLVCLLTFRLEAKKLKSIARDIAWDTPSEAKTLRDFGTQQKSFAEAYRALKTYSEDHKAEIDQKLHPSVRIYFSSFLRLATAMYEGSTELLERFQKPPKTRFSQTEQMIAKNMPGQVRGAPQKIYGNYNALVDSYNNFMQ